MRLIPLLLLLPLVCLAQYQSGSRAELPFGLQVARGQAANVESIRFFGEIDGAGITASGEDVWPGPTVQIPIPPDAGEQMTVVSTSAQDAAGGTGIRTLDVFYLDAAGIEREVTITMAGAVGVDLPVADIRWVSIIHARTVGCAGVAVGEISIYRTGDPTRVYDVISIGGNHSLRAAYMVPAGKRLYVTGWHAAGVGGKETKVRLRATSSRQQPYPGVFLFKDVITLKDGGLAVIDRPPMEISPLAIVKVSIWPKVAGAIVSASVDAYLVDE